MIWIRDVVKKYSTRHGVVTVLDNVNLDINKGEKIGILGRNGAGKSTLIRLISGAEKPTSGTVHWGMSISWPLAFTGGFQGSLTGLDNLKFICRIYGIDASSKIDYIQEFSELGRYLYEPLKTYSSGMRARLAFALSMAIDFDCFLIDEVVAVGDSRFHERCKHELFEKRKEKTMIIVSHQSDFIKAHCTRAAVLVAGRIHQFEQVDEAMSFYHEHL
ncbi:ABC transporter ATP-binding protein [Trichlorobacter lovleyi]|jgi:ABC-type polysaccharide/polyol phosphate transport system, ATPase component|uniref:ABC transporter related n=1 Tax=Trichlorobacter lovleyi (strain ATCC BAA-1151 / DSM 17278 / SZ) TaxID=398767 RepID=B3E8X2_TRIL1|nr:ABC transporter ATP-binding protein [Trichlorobacter lovleyi]ACD95240.1 ABC transporter related [Trichlorobacter lovleyi SZ]